MRNLNVLIFVLLSVTILQVFPQEFQANRTPKHIASRAAYSPNSDQTKKVNIDADKHTYRRKNVGLYPHTHSQMFNVGYSMSFNGENSQYQPKFIQKPRLDNGEIITGKRKRNEEVLGPNMDLSPQEFVAQALMKSKMYRAKNNKPRSTQVAAESLINQANFSPKTQQYIKSYEKSKTQQKYPKMKPQNEYSWRNLSPGVEIVKSSEIPINHKLSSEPIIYYSTEAPKPKLYNKVKEIESQQVEPITQKYSEQIKEEFDPIKDFNYNFNHAGALESSQTFDLSNGLENTLLKFKENQIPYPKQNEVPKLPIDTTLLREPILTTNPKEVMDNPQVIPIHFDIRPLQQAMKNPDAFEAKYPTTFILPMAEPSAKNEEDFSTLYQQQPVLNYQQGMHEDYSYQDYQMASQNQFKIYGKPQPMKKMFYPERPRQPRHDYIENIAELRPPPIAHKYQRRSYHHH